MQAKRAPVLSRPTLILSDIHGNAAALARVLEAAKTEGVGNAIALGDHFLAAEGVRSADAGAVWKMLQAHKADLLRGASDTALVNVDASKLRGVRPSDEDRVRNFVRAQESLGDLILERVRRLPERARYGLVDGRSLLAVHGSPSDPLMELAHDASDDELLEAIDDDVSEVIVVGSAHLAFERKVGEYHLIACGSVGAAPGGDVAHYTILDAKLSGEVEVRARHVRLS